MAEDERLELQKVLVQAQAEVFKLQMLIQQEIKEIKATLRGFKWN